MIRGAVCRESHRLIPQLSSFTRPQQNSEFAAGCVVGFTGGCPNSGPEQWCGHGGSLQIIPCSLFNGDICGARLAHEACGRRIFGTACCLRCRRAAGKERKTRDSSDQANGYFRVFKLHRRRACSHGRDDSEELFCVHQFSCKTLGLYRITPCCATRGVQLITNGCSGIFRFRPGIERNQSGDQDRHIQETSHSLHCRKPARSS